MGLLIVAGPEIGIAFEPGTDQRHQLWHPAQVPVRIGDLDVAHVGGQRQHPLMEVHALFVPQDQAPHGKAVAKIVDPRLPMPTTIDPTQLPSQQLKHPMSLPVTQWLAAARTS